MIQTPEAAGTFPELSVIIVNWNVGHLVKGCLRSLYELTTQVSFEVFLVDNGSAKGDLDEVISAFPQVHAIFLNENLGFAKANNLAIKLARAAFVVLLNPDTYLRNHAFDAMVAFLRKHPEVGAVGPKLRSPNGSIQFDAGRNLPTLLTEFSQQFFLYRLFPKSRLGGSYYIRWWDHQDTREVGALCGACMMVRREVILKAGALDESFFLYWEDAEWCYRIKKAGWRLVYQAEAEVMHLGGHSMSQDSAIARLASFEGCVHFFRKHHGWGAAQIARALILGGSILRLFLWLGLSVLGWHRPEARQRVRCYFQTIFWALGGRFAPRVLAEPAASTRLAKLPE